MKADGGFRVVSPCKAVASVPSRKTSMSLEQQQQQQQQQQDDLEGLVEFSVPASKKLRVEAQEEDDEDGQDSWSEGSSEEAHGGYDDAESGKLQGWAPPGLGVCQLWAQQASSLKRKNGASASTSFSPFSFSESASSPASTERRQCPPVAVGFGVDDAVPATREDKAKLVGGHLGTSRPGYGDASRTPVWWPAEVPWLKGVSISQMNNATLHTLVLAVKAHQRQERRQAIASGAELPDGLVAFAPKTKKEMSRLIRSIQGRRLEYGKEGKRPLWWPKNCPWDSNKPLSTMKHAEVTSVFKAMVREGLLSDADVNGTSSSCKTARRSATGKNNGSANDHDNDRAVDSQAEYGGEATSDNDGQGDGGGGGGGDRHQSASDSSSERSGSSSFWDGDDDGGAVGDVIGEISPLCDTIDPDSAEDLPLMVPVQRGVPGLMPPSKQQQRLRQHHLAQQQQQQQQQEEDHQQHLQYLHQQQLLQQQQQQQHFQQQSVQRPLEFHGGGLELKPPPGAPATATFPGWTQPQPLGKPSSSSSSFFSSSSQATVGGFLVAGQVGTSPASTGAPSLPESVPCSPAKLPPAAATPKIDEESAWQGRALFEELLLFGVGGGLNGNGPQQSCGFQGEDSSGTERMLGFSPLDDDLVFAVGGQGKPLQ